MLCILGWGVCLVLAFQHWRDESRDRYLAFGLVLGASPFVAALIWFGVMICVNVQTSFMHPPFGFALFYLRSVAPKEVKSSDIYWGSVPWVLLQLIMVAIVIFVPWTVTVFLDKPSGIDPSKIKIEIQAPPSDDAPPPVFGAPPKN